MVNVEILTIQVGQCGNQIGANFWQKVNEEYKLDENGLFVGKSNERFSDDYMNTYFKPDSNGKKYTPRTVLVDLDRTVLDDIKQSKLKNYFNSENFLYPNTELSANSEIRSGENNWAIGHYTDDAKMVDRVLDAVRKEIEACDCIHGFNLIHSIGGGTGSGFGTLMISKIREEYPDRIMLTNTVLPSPSPHSANVFETYNSILSVHELVENTDITVCYDNLALRNVCLNRLNQKSFTLDDQNSIISRCMLNQTSCKRMPHQQEIDLRKMAVSLVPFPRLHFFVPFLSFSNNKGLMDAFKDTSTNNLASVDFRHGRFLTLANIYRGKDLSLEEVFTQTLNLQSKNWSYFVEWIPNNCVIGVCQEPEKNIQVSSTFISNTTAIEVPFNRLGENFTAMFRRKAFLHHYTGEGMDEMEFTEAESNMNDLVSEYQHYQDATADEERSEAGDEDAEQA